MKYFYSFINEKVIFAILIVFPIILNAQQNVPGMILNSKSINTIKDGMVTALPLFNKSFKKKGHSSPMAFGIASSALMYQQEYFTNDLKVRGTYTSGEESFEVSARGGSINQNTIASEFKAYLKPNLWILPFLNIYGIFGYTSGQINPNLEVDGIIVENPFGSGDLLTIDTTIVLDETIKYSGSTFGFGTTFSIGYKNLVFLLDYQYTVTNPSDLDENLYNHFLSPKIGWMINSKSDKLNFMVWAGTLFLSNNQSFKGEITVSEISPELVPLFGETAEYSGTIEAKQKWNLLIGSTIIINNHHNVFVEFGFASRLQSTIGYGFMF